MTTQEFMRSEEFAEALEKIRGYRPGFTFTVRYVDIPSKGKVNAIKIILETAQGRGWIMSIDMGYGFNEKCALELFEETFERTEVGA